MIARLFEVASRRSDRLRRDRMWSALFQDPPPRWALEELREEGEKHYAREQGARSSARMMLAVIVLLVLGLLALGMTGCGSAEVKDAAKRASDSAASLRDGYEKIAPYVRPVAADDVAAIRSLVETMRERIGVHQQLVDELKAVTEK